MNESTYVGDQPEKESLKVLRECAEVQIAKSNDYQNPSSRIVQADHYPRGISTLVDACHGKVLRMYSVLETMENGGKINFESLEDSAKDCINYCSFFVAWLRGKIPGQNPNNDIFNRRITNSTNPALIPLNFQRPQSVSEPLLLIEKK